MPPPITAQAGNIKSAIVFNTLLLFGSKSKIQGVKSQSILLILLENPNEKLPIARAQLHHIR